MYRLIGYKLWDEDWLDNPDKGDKAELCYVKNFWIIRNSFSWVFNWHLIGFKLCDNHIKSTNSEKDNWWSENPIK